MTDLIPIRRELLERIIEEHAPSYHDCIDLLGYECEWCELRAALAAPVQVEAEPVIWRCRIAGSENYAYFPSKRCRFCEPLYTTPPQPAGWKLVPERMHLDSSVIETIQAHCGDGQEGAGFGPYSDGVLWIGECEEEDGSKTYGLHIATADYPEEGSSTLVEFAAAPSAPATVQGDGWIPIIERLPQIKQVLSEKCTLDGREIPTLYRSGMVLTFDGSRVSAGIVEWFHSKSPLNNVTHWMPLPAAPGRQEVK